MNFWKKKASSVPKGTKTEAKINNKTVKKPALSRVEAIAPASVNAKEEVELLRQKISEMAVQQPEKVAVILSHWLGESGSIKQKTKKVA